MSPSPSHCRTSPTKGEAIPSSFCTRFRWTARCGMPSAPRLRKAGVSSFRTYAVSGALARSRRLASLEEHADDVMRVLTASASSAPRWPAFPWGYIAFALVAAPPAASLALRSLADTRAAADSPEGAPRTRREHRPRRARRCCAARRAPLAEAPVGASDPRGSARVRALGERQPAVGVMSALAAMRDRPDSTPLLASIAVPVLVIVGEADSISPPAEAQAIAAALPHGGALAVIAGAGHLANLESPATFMAALLRWLDG